MAATRHMTVPVRTKLINPAVLEAELTMKRATNRRGKADLLAGILGSDWISTYAMETPWEWNW
jgi:hypothetical protein